MWVIESLNMRFLVLIGLLLVMAGCSGSTNAPATSKAPTASSEGEVFTLPYNILCSKSLGDIATINRVVQAGDREGMAGLVERGKALALTEGTVVYFVKHDAERATIIIRSGTNVGEDCWVQPSWLKR